MAIKRIKVANFKSFKELDIELGNFNVIVGANASGKSNFTQIFKFLRDIEENSLNDAISMNGGLESLRNLNIGSSREFTMQTQSDTKFGWGKGSQALKIHEITYQFSLQFNKQKNGYKNIHSIEDRCYGFSMNRMQTK